MIRKSSNDPGDFSKRRAGHSRPALQALVYSSLHHHHSQLLLVMWIRTEAFELVQPVWVAHRMSFADFRAPPRNTIAANNAKGQPLRGKVIFWVRDQTMQLLYERKVTPRCEKLSCVNIDEELHSLIRNSLGRVNKKKEKNGFIPRKTGIEKISVLPKNTVESSEELKLRWTTTMNTILLICCKLVSPQHHCQLERSGETGAGTPFLHTVRP
jgi:hypothetical protein